MRAVSKAPELWDDGNCSEISERVTADANRTPNYHLDMISLRDYNPRVWEVEVTDEFRDWYETP